MHLLKSNAKQIKPRQKRKKVELLGTFAQYSESKKKPVADPKEVAQQIVDAVMLAPQPNVPFPGKDDLKKKK